MISSRPTPAQCNSAPKAKVAASCSKLSRPIRLRITAEATADASMPAAAPNSRPAAAARRSAPKLFKVVEPGKTSELPLPPGPPFMLPLIGETWDLDEKSWLKFGLERLVKYGPVFKTSFYGMTGYMVCDPEMFKQVMAEDAKMVVFGMNGSFVKLQGEYTTKVLTDTTGLRMGFRRSMLGAVTQDAMAGYVPGMLSIVKDFVDPLAKDGTEWPLSASSRGLSMKFANSLFAGLKFTSKAEEQQLLSDLNDYLAGFLSFDLDLPGTPLRKAQEAKVRLYELVSRAVTEQMDEIKKEKPAAPGQTKIRKSMLGYVLDFHRTENPDKEVSVIDMTELSLGILQAGTDTSGAGLSGLLGILGKRPDLIQRLRDEQRQAISTHGADITKPMLDSCKLLDACVREAMRFISPGAMNYRLVKEEFEMGGYRLPQGSVLLFNIPVLQALEVDPGYLDRARAVVGAGGDLPVPLGADLNKVAEQFLPERWLEPDAMSKYHMFTFSHGPHACVGMGLFVQESKVLLSYVLRHWDLQLVGGPLEWQLLPLVKPAEELKMKLVPLATPLV